MSELLFEIGCEEIPSSYILPAVTKLGSDLGLRLEALSVNGFAIKTFATPRRLGICVTPLPASRPVSKIKALGPPVKNGLDENGELTKAGIGFARSKKVEPSSLTVEKTDKGEYLCAQITEGGEKMIDLLASILPDICAKIPFPKSMTWGDGQYSFTRPVHWVLALFDDEIIDISFAGVKAGNITYGHRFMAPDPIEITKPADYFETLQKAFVIADIDERRVLVKSLAEKAAIKNSVKLLADDELVETITFLSEWPVALYGTYDKNFLDLPDELLVASMKDHQKMFAVEDKDGRLANGFIGVSNVMTDDNSLVVAGYERVLRARLSDARFFFDEDCKKSLDSFVEKLGTVVYQKKLGTVGAKIERLQGLALHIAEKIESSNPEFVSRAAKLAKADLESLMVYEFPELAGIMGREYALMAGEPPEVATAVYEHYLPRFAGDKLPATTTGAIIAIADRIDTLSGIFGIGKIPTGTQDPFALRRAVIGTIAIITTLGLKLDLTDLLKFSLEQLKDKIDLPPDEVCTNIKNFFEGRLKTIWISAGFGHDVVSAVAGAGIDDLDSAQKRIEAMGRFRESSLFDAFFVTFKRVSNIAKSKPEGLSVIDINLFENEAERDLHTSFVEIAEETSPMIKQEKYYEALELIARLRPKVDKFFDDVLVMAKDEKIRNNRLALLSGISSLAEKIADFSVVTVMDGSL